MANLKGFKLKFLLFKLSDFTKYLSEKEQWKLVALTEKVEQGRKEDGKNENTYLVINTDEPYADEVIEIMKRHGHWG